MKNPNTTSALASRSDFFAGRTDVPQATVASKPMEDLFLEISNPVVNHRNLEWEEHPYPDLPRLFRATPAKDNRIFAAVLSQTSDRVRIFCYRGSLETLMVKLRRLMANYGIDFAIDAWKYSERHVLVYPRVEVISLISPSLTP